MMVGTKLRPFYIIEHPRYKLRSYILYIYKLYL